MRKKLGNCTNCQSDNIVKNGHNGSDKPQYHCKDCDVYRILEAEKKYNDYLNDSKINLIFLPPYSPNLSLIERLWRFLRKKIIRTIYYESFSLFKTEILNFLDNINQFKQELGKFVGTKLHLLPAYLE